jgi:hypothetical protein
MLLNEDRYEEIKQNTICTDCVGETYLCTIIDLYGKQTECSYCGGELACISLEDLADEVESAFHKHYTRTTQEPNGYEYAMLKDKEIDYEWERKGQQTTYAIMDAAHLSEEAAGDVQAILEYRHEDFDDAAAGIESEFSSDAQYEEIMPGDAEWRERWDDFEKLIKTEARFFSRTAANYLAELFDRIDEMKTYDGRPLVVSAGPETDLDHLYRGRVFQTNGSAEKAIAYPDRELSAPPAWAAGAGRMNARGISVFYGATTPGIVLAEVRPPVGSLVALARFEIIRPLRLLDLTALEDVHQTGSIFDPDYARLLERMAFLKTLGLRMARPVMPDDQEMEYLPTQAIADYLSTEAKVELDGILYPSVQSGGGGLNVVLFHKAARCAELDIPKGTEVNARTHLYSEDGYEPDFSVIEEVPPPGEKDHSGKEDSNFFDLIASGWSELEEFDPRYETLRIDIDSVRAHEVQAVEIKTADHAVTRFRWEKKDLQF